jgi:type IV secretion system protein TrbL
LAALFWAWGTDEEIIARLVTKTLFVGVFAYLIGNWNNLARIVFESFAGLGLKASGTALSSAISCARGGSRRWASMRDGRCWNRSRV